MAISNAVGTELLSRVVGYKIEKGDFRSSSPNLPVRVAILGEANRANQGTLDLDPKEITTLEQAGEEYGYGSPIYNVMRILRPVSGTGIGGIPTVVYPQAEAPSAAACTYEITPSGTATGNGTHKIKIAGRTGVDGSFYNIPIVVGDSVASVSQKIEDAINNVLGAPVTAAATATECEISSKWLGATGEFNIEVLTNGFDIGITYVKNQVSGSGGYPSIQTSLDSFGNEWNTIVINTYGLGGTDALDALEAFNGVADPDNPTGRYAGTIFHPFVALTGWNRDDPSGETSGRSDEMTIAVCPAPASEGFHFEAAANYALLFARKCQDTPHLDIGGDFLPDMPTPTELIWSSQPMSDYLTRDAISKKGSSTVDIVSGRYQVQDFITTYHKTVENPPQFKYCRNLVGVDYNVRYSYFLKEQLNVVDHVISKDEDTVTASKVIKPKRWKAIVGDDIALDLTTRALIVDPDFLKESLRVGISTSNPDRLETFFKYKRSAVVRIASTTGEAGFNFGEVQ